jgi:hypothetical protein
MSRDDKPKESEDKRVSVMSWLVEISQAVAKKLKGGPTSPLARIHD